METESNGVWGVGGAGHRAQSQVKRRGGVKCLRFKNEKDRKWEWGKKISHKKPIWFMQTSCIYYFSNSIELFQSEHLGSRQRWSSVRSRPARKAWYHSKEWNKKERIQELLTVAACGKARKVTLGETLAFSYQWVMSNFQTMNSLSMKNPNTSLKHTEEVKQEGQKKLHPPGGHPELPESLSSKIIKSDKETYWGWRDDSVDKVLVPQPWGLQWVLWALQGSHMILELYLQSQHSGGQWGSMHWAN